MRARLGAIIVVIGFSSAVGSAPNRSSDENPPAAPQTVCEVQRQAFVSMLLESAQAAGQTVSLQNRPDGVAVLTYSDNAEFIYCSGTTLEVHFLDPVLSLPEPPLERR